MKRVPRRLAVINCIAVMTLPLAANSQLPATNPPPDERFKADILVIAPHPDDESTIAGYLAKAVLDEHRRVAVVVTTRGDAGQNLAQALCAQAAGSAFAAGFARGELEKIPGEVDHARGVVHDDHAA